MRTFSLVLPQVTLVITALFLLLAEIVSSGGHEEEGGRLAAPISIAGLAAAFLQTVATYYVGPEQIFDRTLSIDGLSIFFGLVFIVLAATAILGSTQSEQIPRPRRTEFAVIALGASVGMSLAAAASDLMLGFLSLLLVQVMGTLLSSYGKRSVFSVEAGVKQLVSGAVASAFFLYGAAILFSWTKSLNLYVIHQAVLTHALPAQTALISCILFMVSILFLMGAFPMHFGVPDVLQGAPTPCSAFLSVGPRAAGTAFAIRLFVLVYAQPSLVEGEWQAMGIGWPEIMAVASALTLLVGAFLAVKQSSAKRMIGCLAVIQAGFLLMGILVLDQVGLSAVLFNIVVDLFAFTGAFSILAFFEKRSGSDQLEALRGAVWDAVPEGICLMFFLLCLAGVPPTPGFFGKFALLGSAAQHQWLGLVVTALISMAVSTFAVIRLFLRLVSVPGRDAVNVLVSRQWRIFLASLVVPTVLIAVFADDVLAWTSRSLGFILW